MRQLVAPIIAAAALWATGAQAQETPTALAEVYACAGVQDAQERLACYDAAVAALQAADAGGDFAAVDRAQVETLEREAFGFSLPTLPRLFRRDEAASAEEAVERPAASPDSLQATVARVQRRGSGRTAFILDNGQVWTQIESERADNVREGDAITIRRNAMGGYILSPERGAAHRVRREE